MSTFVGEGSKNGIEIGLSKRFLQRFTRRINGVDQIGTRRRAYPEAKPRQNNTGDSRISASTPVRLEAIPLLVTEESLSIGI